MKPNTYNDTFQVTGQKSGKSRYGKEYTQLFLKNLNLGKSFSTFLHPDNNNYKRWQGKIARGTLLKQLVIKQGNLVDADSMPIVVKEEVKPVEPPKAVEPVQQEQAKLIDLPPVKPKHYDMG